jgi:hypothetical protein
MQSFFSLLQMNALNRDGLPSWTSGWRSPLIETTDH